MNAGCTWLGIPEPLEQFIFNLKAGNNEVVLTSERYTSKASAPKGVEAVRVNAPLDQRYGRLRASNKQAYFVLRAGNHEVLGTSETYSSPTAREAGISAVKACATAAKVDDETRA